MGRSVPARRARVPCPMILASVVCLVALALQAPSWAARAITRVDIRPADEETVIALFASDEQPLEVDSFSLQDPPRLVFDFPGARLDPDLPSVVPVVAPALQQIRLGQFSLGPDIARLVVDLSEDSGFPECGVAGGGEPGETLLALKNRGPALLGRPSVETVEGAALVRLSGASQLPRSVATLGDPPRVYADVTDAVVEEVHTEGFAEGVIREVRMGQQPADPAHPVARIVLELREEQAYGAFGDGDDLVLAVAPHPWGLPLPEYRPDDRLRGKCVVVDPGHGGDHIGAPAVFGSPPQGPFEKDIVLDIGHRLARLLRAEGARATMTREDDRYVALKERAALANRLPADAFVSIHCNSCDEPDTLHGTSVYYDHRHSARFAAMVQEELVAALGTEDKGVRNANFAVIRRTRTPGILVEMAYINHAQDRARLVHPNSRERAARAILQGLIRFLSDSPDRRRSAR